MSVYKPYESQVMLIFSPHPPLPLCLCVCLQDAIKSLRCLAMPRQSCCVWGAPQSSASPLEERHALQRVRDTHSHTHTHLSTFHGRQACASSLTFSTRVVAYNVLVSPKHPTHFSCCVLSLLHTRAHTY